MAHQHELDIVGLVEVAARPVSIAEITATLDLDSALVVETVERLVEDGVLADSPAGILRGKAAFDVSSARAALLAGKWADALIAAGASPLAIGRALQTAGRLPEASPHFVEAARAGGPEAAEAASLAIDAGELDRSVEGELRLIRARHYRGVGRSLEAAGDLEVAVRRLSGPVQVDAVGFAAAVADDRQRPGESATYAALGAGLAAGLGESAKQGSLLTLLGRSLNRIGFPDEADAAHATGQALLEAHGAPIQRFLGRMNEGWIHLDRGEVRHAEAIFASLRDRAMDVEGEISLADKEAYWARTLFGIGHISEGLAAQGRALLLAEKTKSVAVEFLAAIAGVEGRLAVGDDVGALEWADRALALSLEHLPSWENGMRALRAKALTARGEIDAARSELEAALALCPDGADGWRWRLTIQALAIALTAEETAWPRREAEDLTDELLQARLYSSAVELMTARSVRERDPELGEQAAALALQLGNPTLAAAAAEAADLWKTPLAGGVARAVRAIESHIPAENGTTWRALPGIGQALAVEPAGDPEGQLLQQRIDDALKTAGLAGVDVVLSPAQRRSGGLVRRRPPRRSPWIRTLAAALGVVGVTVLTVGVIGILQPDPPPATTTPTTTSSTTTTTTVPVPDQLAGIAETRGGATRTGQAVGGFLGEPGEPWRITPGGDITSELMIYGQLIYVGTSDTDAMRALNISTGEEVFFVPTTDRVRSTPAIAQIGETTFMVFGSDDGKVYARNAFQGGVSTLWERQLGRVAGNPVIVESTVYVATTDGRLLALRIDDGEVLWEYTGTEALDLAAVNTSPAYADGVFYLGADDGFLHLVDLEGNSVCEPFNARSTIVGNPILEDGYAFVPTRTGAIQILNAGTCGGTPEGRTPSIVNSVALAVPPAVKDGIVFVPEEQRLLAFDSRDGQLSVWPLPYDAAGRIVTAPVIAGGVIYIATQPGVVHAIDASTGEGIWTFDVGEPISPTGTPAVIDKAVYLTTATGKIVLLVEKP